MAESRLILASASPRRVQLLAQIGIHADIVKPADIDECPLPGELPRHHAKRLALGKAGKISEKYTSGFVLAADTVVGCGRRILDKTEDENQARQHLKLLSGRRHRVYGAVCLITPEQNCLIRQVQTAVSFKVLHDDEIDGYIKSGEWQDKAGSYAIQGLAARFITKISGSYSNVVGLPLYETASLLEGAGYIKPGHSPCLPSTP